MRMCNFNGWFLLTLCYWPNSLTSLWTVAIMIHPSIVSEQGTHVLMCSHVLIPLHFSSVCIPGALSLTDFSVLSTGWGNPYDLSVHVLIVFLPSRASPSICQSHRLSESHRWLSVVSPVFSEEKKNQRRQRVSFPTSDIFSLDAM